MGGTNPGPWAGTDSPLGGSNGHGQVCWADTRTHGRGDGATCFIGRRRAHWRPMDDEEEDMALQPIISQRWGSAPYRDFKTDEVSGQHIPFAKQPLLRHHADGPLGIDLNPQHCGSRAQSCTLLHGKSGLQSCPVTSSSCPHSEPMEDRGERQALVEELEDEEEEEEEEREEQQQQQQQEEQAEDKEENDGGDEEDHGSAERPGERVGVSVEVEIGRRLREIGDQFDHDHAELFHRHQREALPVWMRLTAALLGFLFPREAMVPQLRGEQR
ncbi:unnamed protein product [Merluccius merluccius]